METLKFTANVLYDPTTNKITEWSNRKVILGENIIYKDPELGSIAEVPAPAPAPHPATDPAQPSVTATDPVTAPAPVPVTAPVTAPVTLPLQPSNEHISPDEPTAQSVTQPTSFDPTQSQDQPENCRDSELFYENRADGNCLFDSIAQIYHPVDYRNLEQSGKENFTKAVSPIVNNLRYILRDAYYAKGLTVGADNMRTKPDNMKTMFDYANYIYKDKAWGSDHDLEILVNLLGIHNVKIIRNGKVLENAMVNSSNTVETGYTFCNISNNAGNPVHWVLKKGGLKRDFNTDYKNAREKLHSSDNKSGGKGTRKLNPIPRTSGEDPRRGKQTRRILFSTA